MDRRAETTASAGPLARPAVHVLGIALALSFVLHAPGLPLGVSVLFVVYMLLLGFGQYRARRSPLPETPARQRRSRYLGYVLLALATITVYASYGYLLGRDPMLALFPLLAVLKFREMRSARDYQVLVMMGFFMLATYFIHAQGLYTALLTIPILILLTAAPLFLHGDLEPPRLRRALALGARILAVSIPFMIVGFVLFPRLPGPLWNVLRDPSAARSGLSVSMTPGSISNLSLSDEIVFRVEFHGTVPGQEELYWRGPVFWHLRGDTWSAGTPLPGARLPRVEVDSKPLFYSVTLDPSPNSRMFAIDLPAQAPAGASLSPDLQLLTARPILERTRYQLTSYTRYRIVSSGPEELMRALQLPPDYNPRAVALAQSWRDAGLSTREIIRQILKMFHEGGFVYTRQPERARGDSADFLLFESREGFCEHFASAFAILARAAGIPARIVTGYQGGTLNQIGGYYTIRQRDAHAWVEVWQRDTGWSRVDPTLAVAPSRIRQGLQGLLEARRTPDEQRLLDRGERLRTMWSFTLDGLDAINNGWNQWVLGYDRKRQLYLLSELVAGRHGLGLFALLLAGCIPVLLLGYLFIALRRRERSTDPVMRAYQRFTARLSRVGVVRHPAQGPVDFARQAVAACAGQGHIIHAITRLYVRLRYGDGRGDPARLGRMVRAFRPRRSPPTARHTS